MKFKETLLAGAYVVEIEEFRDDRGFFARSWCSREFGDLGLCSSFVQCNISFNARRGTLRGMHYQAEPCEEVKLVRCTSGAMFDVVVDLRPGSATYLKWVGVELSAANRKALYVPVGLAHGFVALEDETEVFYQMSEYYAPELARGVRWDDPVFSIEWPIRDVVVSDRDRAFPDYLVPSDGSTFSG